MYGTWCSTWYSVVSGVVPSLSGPKYRLKVRLSVLSNLFLKMELWPAGVYNCQNKPFCFENEFKIIQKENKIDESNRIHQN